jgi:multicomponent Na+:H+ antiporter subunit G
MTLAGVVQVLGAALVLLAGIGLLRLPDALTRASAVSKAAVLGVGLVLLGVLLDQPDLRTSAVVLVVLVLHVLTVPLSGLAIGTAGYAAGAARPPATTLDEPAAQGLVPEPGEGDGRHAGD